MNNIIRKNKMPIKIFKKKDHVSGNLKHMRNILKYLLIFISSATLAFIVIYASEEKGYLKNPSKILTNVKSMKNVLKNDTSIVRSHKDNNSNLADAWVIISAISKLDTDDYIIIDMRSHKDYATVHLKETVNIPYPYTNADHKEAELFLDKVKKLHSSKKQIILIPYSIFSATGYEAQTALGESGIQSKLLSAGWNELYNLPNLWMPESEWENLSVIDLIEGVEELH